MSAGETIPDLAHGASAPRPPRRSAAGWLRANLFGGPASGAATIAILALAAWLSPGLIRYLLIDAVWSAPDGAACRASGAGACWAFVADKLDYFRYGAYPLDQRWRIDLTLTLGAVLLVRLLYRARTARLRAIVVCALVVPICAAVVAPGPQALAARPWPELAILVGSAALSGALVALRASLGWTAGLFFILYPIASFVLLRGASFAGLPIVDTSLWGGLTVTLLISVTGIVASIPGGVLLALGRRSRLPAVRACAVGFIEIVRGVPLVTVLFMANTMLPLFVPEQYAPDRLLRPLIGVALFASAYMAEVVRGGLQALPRGQFEAAGALGFGYWGMMRLVVLPQALTIVIPGIVNSCIALFKDTTLVAAVGIYDFLAAVDTARIDPKWVGPNSSTTAYAFAAIVYWLFCFGMSRYSQNMERRLQAGSRR